MRKMKQKCPQETPSKTQQKKNVITLSSAIKNRNTTEETVMQFRKWWIIPIKLCGLRGITSCPAQLI